MNNLWKEYGNVIEYEKKSKLEQDRILRLLSDKANFNSYYYDSMIESLIGKISDTKYFELAKNVLSCGSRGPIPSASVERIIKEAFRIDHLATKDLFLASDSKMFNKLILICNNISIDEEIFGLRTISGSKYIPEIIRKSKYCPRLDALLKIPPIMRLKTLEALSCSNSRISYNMFKNISDSDFKALLFTPILKYSDRVESLCNKYDEIKYMGIEATVAVKANCESCGDYVVTLKSDIVRTKTGMSGYSIGRFVLSNYCLFCSANLNTGPTFIENP